MNGFEEMCAAYARSRVTYFGYREKCFNYMGSLVSEFIRHCGIPEEQIRFVPDNEEPKENTLYSLPGAMHLDEDTFWHVGLRITLYEKPNVFPHQPVLLVICVKEMDGKLLVKVGAKAEAKEVDLTDKNQRETLFRQMIGTVINFFEGSLQEFLEKEAPLKTIGFIQ